MSQKTANAVPGDDVFVPNKTSDASDPYLGTTYQGDEFLSDEVIRDLRDHNMTFSSRRERGKWKIQRAMELLEEAKEDLGLNDDSL